MRRSSPTKPISGPRSSRHHKPRSATWRWRSRARADRLVDVLRLGNLLLVRCGRSRPMASATIMNTASSRSSSAGAPLPGLAAGLGDVAERADDAIGQALDALGALGDAAIDLAAVLLDRAADGAERQPVKGSDRRGPPRRGDRLCGVVSRSSVRRTPREPRGAGRERHAAAFGLRVARARCRRSRSAACPLRSRPRRCAAVTAWSARIRGYSPGITALAPSGATSTILATADDRPAIQRSTSCGGPGGASTCRGHRCAKNRIAWLDCLALSVSRAPSVLEVERHQLALLRRDQDDLQRPETSSSTGSTQPPAFTSNRKCRRDAGSPSLSSTRNRSTAPLFTVQPMSGRSSTRRARHRAASPRW